MAKYSVLPLLGRRFLLSKTSDGFLSFIAWVSVLGVSLGILALTVVTSVINGFEGEIGRAITGMNGDVILYSRGNPIARPYDVMEKIRKVAPSVRAITPSMVTELMVSGPHGVAGAIYEGVETKTVGRVTEIPDRIKKGRLPEDDKEVVIGTYLAEKIGAKIGDEVRLIAPFVGDDLESRVFKAEVVGILKIGMYRYDSKYVIARLRTVQKLLEKPSRVTTFKMKLKRGASPEDAAQKLSESFGYPFRAKSWAELDKNLLYAIRLEKAVIAIILTAILIVAAFNVVSTLMMMIYDKTKEIAILKAMGFKPVQNFKLFCGIGMLIGTVGTGLGLSLGIGLNRVIERTKLISLPAEVYNIGHLPIVERWSELSIIVIFGLLICFFAALYPAVNVMRRSPLEGIRYE